MPDSDGQENLSYMEEQRKQGEAGIRVLKRRLGRLDEKVRQRRDHLEEGAEDRWYHPDVLDGNKPKPKPVNARIGVPARKASVMSGRGSVSKESMEPGGTLAPIRKKDAQLQSTQDRLRAILDSYNPHIHEVLEAPPSMHQIETLDGEEKEKAIKARHDHMLKHSISAQLLRRNTEEPYEMQLPGTKRNSRRGSIVFGLQGDGLSKSKLTQSTGLHFL